jgi:hypothetical protein
METGAAFIDRQEKKHRYDSTAPLAERLSDHDELCAIGGLATTGDNVTRLQQAKACANRG